MNSRTGTEAVRTRSKRMFGGTYRIEVAAAIGAMRGWWTKPDLIDSLAGTGIPESCINKELQVLAMEGMVEHKRCPGHHQYKARGFTEYWITMSKLNSAVVHHDAATQKVVTIR